MGGGEQLRAFVGCQHVAEVRVRKGDVADNNGLLWDGGDILGLSVWFEVFWTAKRWQEGDAFQCEGRSYVINI